LPLVVFFRVVLAELTFLASLWHTFSANPHQRGCYLLRDLWRWQTTSAIPPAVYGWDFEDRPLPKGSNVLKDQLIRLYPIAAGAPCREDLRLVRVWDERNQCGVQLLTNHLKFAATTIAAIYRERSQIELFFKALKQNLKVKTFVGTSPNAVRSVSRIPSFSPLS
jgi:IS4 transposase